MFTCTICHFATELDDVVVRQGDARCVCLGCFGRETRSSPPMPQGLRRQVSAVLNAPGVA